MLFIHGGKDDFVPVQMAYEVYEAYPTTKDIYIVDEAGHAQSKDYDVEAYWTKSLHLLMKIYFKRVKKFRCFKQRNFSYEQI